MRRSFGGLLVFAVLALLMMLAGLWAGSTSVTGATIRSALFQPGIHDALVMVVRQVRLPQVLTAATAGSGLAVGGLLMQAVFRNPLAGPGVLGITGGASLGVAVVVLLQPLWALVHIPGGLLATVAALAGAMAVLALILLADRRLGDPVTLLIVGLMAGYLCSAIVGLLQAQGEAQALKGFVLWGLGSFAGTNLADLPWLVIPVAFSIAVAFTLAKPLNALALGQEEARTLGVAVQRVRMVAILSTGVLAASITAWCGPIAFLGLAVPHLARAFFRTADHRILLPASALLGIALAVGCDLLVRSSGIMHGTPLNVVTSLLGVPVVLWILLRGRKWGGEA